VTEPALDLFDDESLAEPVADALRRLVIAGFHALWRGRTPMAAEFEAGDPTAVAAAVDHLRARGRIELSDDGRVIAVHGLARRATRHRIEHDDGAVNTWCALDAVGIPAAMGIDARAVTHCPTCGQQLTVTLSRGEPQPLPGAVLWYPENRCAHLVDDFCSGANLFCSVDHLERWLDDNPTAGRVMTVIEAAELGRGTWREASEQATSHGPGSDAHGAPSPPPT
jgi:alkylmercury lyase